MTGEFVLDASFALHWCFEDEATESTESVLADLENQEAIAWVPGIWPHEMLNGLGKAVSRKRVTRETAFQFWREVRQLPIRIEEIPVDEKLLALALEHDLAVYDASYLNLALLRKLVSATSDSKLQQSAVRAGVDVIRP